jgi:hypothetical protein
MQDSVAPHEPSPHPGGHPPQSIEQVRHDSPVPQAPSPQNSATLLVQAMSATAKTTNTCRMSCSPVKTRAILGARLTRSKC